MYCVYMYVCVRVRMCVYVCVCAYIRATTVVLLQSVPIVDQVFADEKSHQGRVWWLRLLTE